MPDSATPLPPPMLPPSTTLPPDATQPLAPRPTPSAEHGIDTSARQHPDATGSRLGGQWRFIAAFGWAVILAAASRLVVAARHLEHEPAWLRIWWLFALLPLISVLGAALDRRWLPWASTAAAGAVAFAAGWDLSSDRRGVGRYELSLAFSAVVLTALIWAARRPRRNELDR
jgi:hypothetical protein